MMPAAVREPVRHGLAQRVQARDDLPEPDSPLITVRRFPGRSSLMFFRFCVRAPES